MDISSVIVTRGSTQPVLTIYRVHRRLKAGESSHLEIYERRNRRKMQGNVSGFQTYLNLSPDRFEIKATSEAVSKRRLAMPGQELPKLTAVGTYSQMTERVLLYDEFNEGRDLPDFIKRRSTIWSSSAVDVANPWVNFTLAGRISCFISPFIVP